jgi:hypothetical protein
MLTSIPTRRAFKWLPLRRQEEIAINQGTYLGSRFTTDMVYVYQVGDFFAELYYDSAHNAVYNCRTFTDAAALTAYDLHESLDPGDEEWSVAYAKLVLLRE